MKANELMIGDWITVECEQGDGSIDYLDGIVDMIDEDGITLKGTDEDPLLCYVNPIEITVEILEANGFTKETFCNDEQRYLLHINDCCIIWADLARWYFDITSNKGELRDFRTSHVHELQHALRLVGLDDLADNFKVEEGGRQ